MTMKEIRDIVGINNICLLKQGKFEFECIFLDNEKYYWCGIEYPQQCHHTDLAIGTNYELVDYFEKEPTINLPIEQVYNTLDELAKRNKFPFYARPVNWQTDHWWNEYWSEFSNTGLKFTSYNININGECFVRHNHGRDGKIYISCSPRIRSEFIEKLWELMPDEE